MMVNFSMELGGVYVNSLAYIKVKWGENKCFRIKNGVR